MNMLVKTIKRVVGKWIRYILKRDIYIVRTNPSNSWIFISYIPFVFYVKDKTKLVSHQKNEEMLAMADVFSNLGYNVYIQYYSSNRALPEIDVSLILGLEPLFELACSRWPKAIKVYYATGAYYEHQNKMVKWMTDTVNIKYGCTLPYFRMVKPHNSCQVSDYILQIGTRNTINTYPESIRPKVCLIHQSSQISESTEPIVYAEKNEYMFMGSSGNALKGIGLLVEYFAKHKEKIIHIVGPIEKEFIKAIDGYITDNILFHGFMNVNSKEFSIIVRRCNFLIYPSGSEGCPGAVINLVKEGLFPIVSRWATIDNDGKYEYILDDLSETSIEKAINWAENLPKDIVVKMRYEARNFVNNTYNLQKYSKELSVFVQKLNK